MDKYRQIAELMKGFRLSGQSFFPATVESVEGMTCTVKVDNLSISDVRLKATNEKTDDSVLLIPAIGSNVLVGSISGNLDSLFIVQANSLSEAFLKVGEISIKLDNNGVIINDGKNDGVVNVKDMVKWMQKVYADLQMLKTLLASSPGKPSGVPLAIAFNPSTENPIQSDFEDKKLKH